MAPRRYRPQTAHRWTGAVRDRCRPHHVPATAISFVHPPAMALRSIHVLLCCLLMAASAQAAATRQRMISRAAVYAQVSILAELGRRLFFDPTLSASGQL